MQSPQIISKKFGSIVRRTNTVNKIGKITKVVGLVIESEGPKASVNEICTLKNKRGKIVAKSEISGFRDGKLLSLPLGQVNEISPGMEITATGETLEVSVSDKLLGRVFDGLGEPLDEKDSIPLFNRRSVYADPPNPLTRKRIREYIATGVKALDSIHTLGKGQRIGIFAGSGVGKSTLLGMIARNTSADVNVIALIGERGREVREFIEKDLQERGLNRSVVIVSTSDQPPLVRVKAALTATTIAEYFRDKGLDVMLMMDSATRLAMAQREVGLSIGEPPTAKGYTPSVFSNLQRIMERAGTSEKGSITGLYTVLVEGDDMNEPIADAARGILDGHIVLSRKLAALAHYPAIDILESISRVKRDVISDEHYKASVEIQQLTAAYRNAEDLISVGAYQKGTNPLIDRAAALNDKINEFLKQDIYETCTFDETVEKLIELSRTGRSE